MSGDEVVVTLIALVLGIGAWGVWLVRAASVATLRTGPPPVTQLAGTLVALAAVIFLILKFCAADDVRNAPQYLFMYLMLGLAWLYGASLLFPIAGLSARDDIIERRNAAAVPTWMGAMTGVALCYGGANIGNGPGWWVVVFSAALATLALLLVWLAMGQWAGVADEVALDRDPAAGIRLGGLLAACGVVFGGAVTGDWVSASATVIDFGVKAWTAGPIVMAAVLVEHLQRPTPERPRAPVSAAGLMPALAYLAAAGASVYLAKDWTW